MVLWIEYEGKIVQEWIKSYEKWKSVKRNVCIFFEMFLFLDI